jgi:hypothetical protein
VNTVRKARGRFALLLAVVCLLAGAPAASAADGVGLWGRADDKVVTLWAFGLMIFFTVLVVVLSFIQGRLERRKDERTEILDRFGRR